MTTYDTFLGGKGMRAHRVGLVLLTKKIYFTQQAAAAGDVFQAIPTLAGDIIMTAWVDVNSKCNTGATIDVGYGSIPNYWGSKMLADALGHCRPSLSGTLTWDAYHIADKSERTNEVEITGARFGDHVTVSSGMDLADMALTGEVIHDDWVAVHLINNTGGGLDLPSQTIGVCVNKAPQMASSLLLSEPDTIDVKANDAITQGVLTVSALIFRK